MYPEEKNGQTGAIVYPPLPVEGVPSTSRLRVCIVMHECVGPTQNNGLGTAYTLLGEALAAEGHCVTFLYVTSKCERHTLDYWAEHYKQKSIEFVLLPNIDAISITAPDWLVQPYRIYLWLKSQTFDVIHYPEYPGHGYFIALAKHQGLAFGNTLLCLGTHGPSMWSREANGYQVNAVRHLATDFLERQVAALSDVLISPSQATIQWMLQQEWLLPERTYVQQNIQSPYALSLKQIEKQEQEVSFKEIVFFGRIEPRKGYKLFCDAIDLLPQDLMHKITVTFLGASTILYSGDTADEVKRRATVWSCPIRIITDKSHEEALDYLHEHSCLAVIPSRDEVMGYVVMECIGAEIPFLASRVGGIPELIAAEDIDRVCFYPIQAAVLAKRIEQALYGGQKAAHPSIAFEDNRKRWIDWHNCHARLNSLSPAPFPKKASPLVSVILVCSEASSVDAETSASISSQDYPNIEVVHACVEKSSNKATAINDAINRARGEYFQIVNNGDVYVPHHLSTCVRVAERTKAAILTSCFETWRNDISDCPHDKSLHLFLGPALSVGAFLNIYGTDSAFVRRETFLALGGYDESLAPEETHYQFYTQAVLKGYNLEVIPEILFCRRIHSYESGDDDMEPAYDAANLKPYFSALPRKLRAIIFPPDGNPSL